MAPALHSAHSGLNAAIKGDEAVLTLRSPRSRLRSLLLGTQVLVSVVLLVVTGSLVSGVVSSFIQSQDLGFEARDAYINRGSFGSTRDKVDTAKKRVRQRLQELPEISHVALGLAPLEGLVVLPMRVGNWRGEASTTFVSDDYFETLGIRLLRGRGFTTQEAERGAPVAVISESTARRFWPGFPLGPDPLGRRVSFVGAPFLKTADYEIIGIAADVRFARLTQVDPLHVYVPNGATARLIGGLLFRINGGRARALAAVRSAVESVDPTLLPGLNLVSIEDGPLALQRGFYRSFGLFAGILTFLSLTLAAIGIYGVIAFLVSRQTHEIGIRIALGANARTVLSGVVLQALRPAFVGALIGIAASALVLALARSVPGPTPFSANIFGPALIGELALVLAIAAIASLIPARRAMRIDPAVALRHE